MNKEQEQIIDEAYENYCNKHSFNEIDCHSDMELFKPNKTFIPYNQEQFINKCKIDSEFSEKWGLKIEERELSLEERMDLSREKRRTYWDWQNWSVEDMEWRMNNDWNIPTRLITITYNNEKIESYE